MCKYPIEKITEEKLIELKKESENKVAVLEKLLIEEKEELKLIKEALKEVK